MRVGSSVLLSAVLRDWVFSLDILRYLLNLQDMTFKKIPSR